MTGSVDANLIKAKKYRVLLDPVNGPATLVFPGLLKDLGCEVFLVNDNLSPKFNRPSEPRAGNLAETAAKVREHQCDFGIATDVDADRVLFIDADGRALSEDLVGAIFASEVISGDKVCVTPVNSSGLIEEVVAGARGKLEYCRIGQPETIKAIKQSGACFSYEESGKYYFSGLAFWPDALLASLKLMEILARRGVRLSELAAEFKPFYQVKRLLRHDELFGPAVKGAGGDKFFRKIRELWDSELKEQAVKDVVIDGLKRIYHDQSWLLIRQSGTEPLVRVYADAPSRERAEELASQGAALVRKAAGK